MTASETADIAPQVAVILYDDSIDMRAVLSRAVAMLTAAGVTVGGLIQRYGDRQANGKRQLFADDIQTGVTLRLDEPRGPGATACILDTGALADGASMLRRAIDSGARVIIPNRFGGVEAEGGGLRAEIADAICCGAAVLVPVRETRLPDFEAFLGAPAFIVPPVAEDIAAWAEQAARLCRVCDMAAV